jgi:hypothetical protein
MAPCLVAEKLHTQVAAKDVVIKTRRHQYLLCQMVPAMCTVATSSFGYSAPLVHWTDAELDKLHAVWRQIQRAACGLKAASRLPLRATRIHQRTRGLP